MDDMHDDGLVHGHGWASETMPMPHATVLADSAAECDHDDGLVHDHGWACAERGRMAA